MIVKYDKWDGLKYMTIPNVTESIQNVTWRRVGMAKVKNPARYKTGLVLLKDNRLARIHGNMTGISYKIVNYILWAAVRENHLSNLQFRLADMMNTLDIKTSKRGDYFKEECKKAAQTAVEIQDRTDTEKWVVFPLIKYIEYDRGMITAEVNEKTVPYIQQLKGSFTPVELKSMVRCGSYPAMRLYEVCLSWKKAGIVKYTVDEWRGLLGARGSTYDIFSQFKRRCWEPAVNYVNRRSDINITSSYTKVGRKVTHITVRITEDATIDVPAVEVPLSLRDANEEPMQTTLPIPSVEEPIDELQSLYEAAGATPSAVRKWRGKYPEDALRWLLGKIKQAKPNDVGAWLGAACKDGGGLMNAYQIEMKEKRERVKKAKNTAYFVIPEIPTDAVPIPFDVNDALEKALVAVIKKHLQNGDLNITAKEALIAHHMQPAEFAERYF